MTFRETLKKICSLTVTTTLAVFATTGCEISSSTGSSGPISGVAHDHTFPHDHHFPGGHAGGRHPSPDHGHGGVSHTPAPPTPRPHSSRLSGALTSDFAIIALAQKYGLPIASAQKFSDLLESDNGISTLAIASDDLASMARYSMPSKDAVEKFAVAIEVSRPVAHEIIEKLIGEVKAEMADVTSLTWKSCTETGAWKTNANFGTCKDLAWQGCSPATGATFCTAVQ